MISLWYSPDDQLRTIKSLCVCVCTKRYVYVYALKEWVILEIIDNLVELKVSGFDSYGN